LEKFIKNNSVNHNRFLVIRPDRIGDVVLSTPIPREIKRAVPESFVAVMVTEYTRDIYLNNPYVDEIITFPGKDKNIPVNEYFKYIRLLRCRKFDAAFMLLPTERINYLLFLSGIRLRIGVGHKFYQFITNTKSVYRRKYIPLRHEADYCIDMLRKIGIHPESLDTEIHFSEDEKIEVNEIRKRISPLKEKIISINSTSGNSAPNMDAGEYKKLIDLLIDTNKFKIAVTDYNPPEIIGSIPGVHYICRGKQLRESIKNIAAVDLLISASTGPMHLAAALKLPTLSLFCPLTACSPKLWGPLGNEHKILLPEENYCSTKCPGDPKKCNFSGHGGIDSQKVFNETIKFLDSGARE